MRLIYEWNQKKSRITAYNQNKISSQRSLTSQIEQVQDKRRCLKQSSQ
jgi:hypothetical protein